MVLTMCVKFDLHLEQLDVKTVFLYVELKKKIICSNERFRRKWERELGFQIKQIFIRPKIDAKMLVQEI